MIVQAQGVPAGVLGATRDGWAEPNVPVLVRGQVKIVPLAWWGAEDQGYNPYAEPKQIASFASHIQGAALHRAGPWSEMDLQTDSDDSVGSYRNALRESGATRADCWAYSDELGIALVWAGTEADGTRSLALHIIPASWGINRFAIDTVDGIDLTWSWTDVVDLAASTPAD